MPVVRATRQVGLTPLPGVRKTAAETPASMGVGVENARANKFDAIAGVAGQVARIGEERYANIVKDERDRADSLALLGAENQISSWENQRLYDPQSGALTVKGKDAMPLPEQVGDEYDTLTKQIAAGLSTTRQKDAFEKVRLDRKQNIDLTLRRHVFGEMQTYERSELNASIDNGTNLAIANALDPRRVGEELQRVETAIKTSGPRLGLGPAAIDKQVGAARSTVHVGVIDRLLAENKDRAASIYFSEAKDQISGDQIARVEKALEEGSIRGEGQRQSDAILAVPGQTLTQQREQARQITDPKIRDEVMQRIEHEAAVKASIDRDTDETRLRGAYDIVDRTRDVKAIPPGQWVLLSGAARNSLHDYADQLNKVGKTQTDPAVYYGLMRKAMADPTTFSNDNILVYRNNLDDADFKQLAGIQLSIRNGDREKAQKELADYTVQNQQVEDSLALYGMDPNAKPNTDEGKSIAQLRQMLRTRVDAQMALTGKKPTQEDVRQMLDGILSQSKTTPGSWWSFLPGGAPFFDQTKRLIDMKVGDIPAAELKQIDEALKKAGRPISDATRLNLYIEHKARGGGK